MDQSTVVIVSDDAQFSAAITARWQAERRVPGFTTMSGDLCRGMDPDSFDLAIVGALRPEALSEVVQALRPPRSPVLFVCDEDEPERVVRELQARGTVLRRQQDWATPVVLLAIEMLRRNAAVERALRAEEAGAVLERQAVLGRYMLEMRHNINNALTSVLGNSELLLIEPGSLSASALAQIETIRNMSIRIHEVMQRFSSLEKELVVVEKQAASESAAKARGAAAG